MLVQPCLAKCCILTSASSMGSRQGNVRQETCLPQVYVPSHPLVKHWLAVARNRLSPPPVFRSALAELGRLLIYEAIEQEDWLPHPSMARRRPPAASQMSPSSTPSRPVMVRVHRAAP